MCRDSSDQDDHRKYLYVHDAEYGATHEFEVVQNDFYERTKFLWELIYNKLIKDFWFIKYILIFFLAGMIIILVHIKNETL